VLGLPVPDGMNIDDDEILTTAEEQNKAASKDDMVNWFEAYVQNQNIGRVDHELREEVENLKKTTDLHSSKISTLQRDLDSVKETITAKIDDLREELRDEFNAKIETVHAHLDEQQQQNHTNNEHTNGNINELKGLILQSLKSRSSKKRSK